MGDPSRGLEPLDPLYVPIMTVYLPNENGLKLTFKENSFSGLSALRLDDLKWVLAVVFLAGGKLTDFPNLLTFLAYL